MKKMKASKWCGSQQHTHYNTVWWDGGGVACNIRMKHTETYAVINTQPL